MHIQCYISNRNLDDRKMFFEKHHGRKVKIPKKRETKKCERQKKMEGRECSASKNRTQKNEQIFNSKSENVWGTQKNVECHTIPVVFGKTAGTMNTEKFGK